MSDKTILRPCGEPLATIDDSILQSEPYAMAYVRMQRWERPLSAGEAFGRGTAFRSLVKPFWEMEVQR